MKKPLCLLLILLTANLLPSFSAAARPTNTGLQQEQAQAKLTNKDVLEMMKSGLSAEIIIAKIKTSPAEFDTSTTALQELKAAGLPDTVILAMVQASASTTEGATTLTIVKDGVEVKVPDGTPLEIELMTEVSSAKAKEGDIIDFTVVNPVVINGVTVIEKGAPAKARVAGVKKAGYWGKAGRVGWIMQDALGVDGNRISLRMEKKLTGDSKGGTVATATIVTAVVFWPAAPFWGFKKGKNAVFPAGKRFEAFVNGDATVKGKPTTASTAQP
jgi:hypothetical protein